MFKIRIGEKNGRKYAFLVCLVDGDTIYVTFDRNVLSAILKMSNVRFNRFVLETPANTDIDVCEKDVFAIL